MNKFDRCITVFSLAVVVWNQTTTVSGLINGHFGWQGLFYCMIDLFILETQSRIVELSIANEVAEQILTDEDIKDASIEEIDAMANEFVKNTENVVGWAYANMKWRKRLIRVFEVVGLMAAVYFIVLGLIYVFKIVGGIF